MNPLIFIPGLYGSMSEEIIPGTGDWSFGIAGYVYNPFIEKFKEFGYEYNKDLFVCHYDWRLDIEQCTEKYLIPFINEHKSHRDEKFDIVAHSMGGLLARCYIQGPHYQNDIQNLIMAGTPHFGSPKSYYAWEGGTTPPDDSLAGSFASLFIKGFLWIISQLYDYPNTAQVIRRHIPSISNFMPTIEHQPYLVKKVKSARQFVPISWMKHRNTMVEKLNRNLPELFNKGINIINIVGKGLSTITYIKVARPKGEGLWEDGEPTGVIKTNNGDGTVVASSAQGCGGQSFIIKSNHTSLLNDGVYLIADALDARYVAMEMPEPIPEKYISLLAKGPVSLNLLNPPAKYHYMDNWIIIQDPGSTRYTLQVTGTGSGEFSLAADSNYLTFDKLQSLTSTITVNETKEYTVQLKPFKGGVSLRKV
jgi:hypothetical protein